MEVKQSIQKYTHSPAWEVTYPFTSLTLYQTSKAIPQGPRKGFAFAMQEHQHLSKSMIAKRYTVLLSLIHI